MPSFKAKLASYFLRTKFKPAIKNLVDNPDKIEEALTRFRAGLEKNAQREKPPKDVEIRNWPQGPGKSEIHKPRNIITRWTLLYLHGGGFKFCSPRTHRAIASFMAKNIPAEVYVPDYRLAPEHKFPAGLEDCVEAYQTLLDQGQAPDRIVVAGDSAGGGLSVSLALWLREKGIPLPAALALMSPYADLTSSGASMQVNEHSDAMFPREAFTYGDPHYHGDLSPENPLISPIFADLSGLPPLIIHASQKELLLDDALRLAARAKAAGVDTTLELFDEMPHVWHILCGQIPEADRDAMTIALFLRTHLGAREADNIAKTEKKEKLKSV